MANEMLSLAYQDFDERKAERLRTCASWLSYKKTVDGLKLDRANFCRVRLCPICQWRRSLKVFGQTCKIVQAFERESQHSYALLTLTLKNCRGEELKSSIDLLMTAWNRLTRTAAWNKVVLGYVRGMEVTHNVDYTSPNFDTYHPHFHVLIALRKSYFTSRDYIRQSEWSALWKRCLRIEYVPIVDIRKCKSDRAGAIAEVTKYTTKSSDYLIPDDWDLTSDAVIILDRALDHRRFVAFGGALAELHKKLNLDDPDEGDLIHVDDENNVDVDAAAEFLFVWHCGFKQYYGGEFDGRL